MGQPKWAVRVMLLFRGTVFIPINNQRTLEHVKQRKRATIEKLLKLSNAYLYSELDFAVSKI